VYKQTEEALKKLLGIFNHTLKLENVEKNEHYAFLEGLVSSEGLVDSMDSDLYGQTLHRSKVQGQLDATIEQILNFSSQNLIDSMSKDRIFQECNRAKRALQNLFETYENRVSL
jgi:regulator of sigma D